MRRRLITREIERRQNLTKVVVAGVSETSMPEVRVAGNMKTVMMRGAGAGVKSVKITGAITSEQNLAGTKILDTKTKRVKFD